jgi:hypothetical protein
MGQLGVSHFGPVEQKIHFKATLRLKETPSVNQALATSSLDSSPETTRFGSGKSVKRLEDQQLLLGAGQYTNDVTLPGQS